MPTFYKDMSSGGQLAFAVSQGTQSTANNTTVASYSLTIKDRNNIGMWADGTWYWSAKRGSTSVKSGSGSGYKFAVGQTHTFGSGSTTVGHTATGTYSQTWVGAFTDIPTAGWFLNHSASGTVTFTTIPRATTPTAPDFTTGVSSNISLPRAPNSGFTHHVSYKFGNKTGVIATAAATSVAFNPAHALFDDKPTVSSGTITFTVQTKSGSTNIGSAVTLNKTLTLNANQVPTISKVEWSDATSKVRTNIGVYVASLSSATAAITAAGKLNSTITRREIIVEGVTADQAAGVLLPTNGDRTFIAKVTDGRGRTAQVSSTHTVLPYTDPRTVTTPLVRRALFDGALNDKGTYLRVDLNAAAITLKNGSTERNKLTVAVRSRVSGSTSWTNRTPPPVTGLTYNLNFLLSGGGIYTITSGYDVELILTDNASGDAIRITIAVPTASVSLDLNGTNVGIGKYRERGRLDVGPGGIYDDGKEVAGYVNRTADVAGTTPPSSFPVGMTVGGGGTSAWPFSYPNLLTFKTSDVTSRADQIALYGRNGGMAFRQKGPANTDDGWDGWNEVVIFRSGTTAQMNAWNTARPRTRFYNTSNGIEYERIDGAWSDQRYSFQEQYTGKQWVDGKKIYEKTIAMGTLPNSTTKYASVGESIDSVVDLRGIATSPTGTKLTLPFVSNTSSVGSGISLFLNASGNISIQAGTDRTSYTGVVTIQYTKT